MKKSVYYMFGLVAMCLVLFASCSSGSPGDAAVKYTNYLKSGDHESFVEGIAFKEGSTDTAIKAGKAMMLAMLEEGQKDIDEQGGIDDVEMISETIAEDGKTAKVTLKITYGDGSTKEDISNMVMQDGKWKMDAKK